MALMAPFQCEVCVYYIFTVHGVLSENIAISFRYHRSTLEIRNSMNMSRRMCRRRKTAEIVPADSVCCWLCSVMFTNHSDIGFIVSCTGVAGHRLSMKYERHDFS